MKTYKVSDKTYKEINSENIKREIIKLSKNIEGLRDVSSIIIGFTEYKFELFNKKQRKIIMEKYDYITKNNILLKDVKEEDLRIAVSGIFRNKTSKEIMSYVITDLFKKKECPIVYENSMTAWGINASENYGLEIRDILKMKSGQKIKLIMFHRNVGDYCYKFEKGLVYDPRKQGLSYAIYTHKNNLTGTMEFSETDTKWENWEWEINGGCNGMYWGTIGGGYKKGKLNPKTKVGWRGPCIDLEDAKNLPKFVTSYGGTWSDTFLTRQPDFLKVERIKK